MFWKLGGLLLNRLSFWSLLLLLAFIKHFFDDVSPSIWLLLSMVTLFWIRIEQFALLTLLLNLRLHLWNMGNCVAHWLRDTSLLQFFELIDWCVTLSWLRLWWHRYLLLWFGGYRTLINLLSRWVGFHSIFAASWLQESLNRFGF